MITGFNTDIDFEGVVYHVQTEDKGLENPIILSLVYDRGTILASKRSPYDDLLDDGLDEAELTERLQKQHKLMCAAVRAGRLEDLKEMTAKNAAASPSGKNGKPSRESKARSGNSKAKTGRKKPIRSVEEEPALSPISKPSIPLSTEPAFADRGVPIPIPNHISIPKPKIRRNTLISLARNVTIVDDAAFLPEDAVAIVSEVPAKATNGSGKLSIEFVGESEFKGGEKRTVCVLVTRGSGRAVVSDVQVMIKVLGSSFRPMIFHSMTDDNGLARMHLQFPRFQTGRATILARALNKDEEVELRRPVLPG